MTNTTPPNKEVAFEEAFTRLEAILERMNSGKSSLDESLKLFEEADGLIAQCSKRLVDAEKRVETLIQQRGGSFATDADGNATTQPFNLDS